MAEEQTLTPQEDQFNETYDVMKNALDDIKAEEDNQQKASTVEATEESPEDEQSEPATDATTDVKAPTYQEAAAAQQESSGTEDVKSEASEETVPESKAGEERGLDDIDAEVYGNLKPKAQERFEHWINKAKELETDNENMKVSAELQDHIMNSGTSPEQLNWSLQVFRSLNSGDYNESVRALKALDTFADQVGDRLGVNKTNNETSSYEDFEDLSSAVQSLEMSEDWANRLASQRVSESSQNQAQEDFRNSQMQQQQYNQYYEQATRQAYNEINEWEHQVVGQDPDYEVKKDILVEIGQDIIKSQIPPEQWLPTLQQQYNTLSRGMSTAAQSNGNASKSSGPLAPSRSSGGVGNAMDLHTPEVTPEFLQAHLDAIHR